MNISKTGHKDNIQAILFPYSDDDIYPFLTIGLSYNYQLVEFTFYFLHIEGSQE